MTAEVPLHRFDSVDRALSVDVTYSCFPLEYKLDGISIGCAFFLALDRR